MATHVAGWNCQSAVVVASSAFDWCRFCGFSRDARQGMNKFKHFRKKTLQVARKMLCLWLSEVFVVGRNYTYIYTGPCSTKRRIKTQPSTTHYWDFMVLCGRDYRAGLCYRLNQPIKDNHVLMLSGKDKGSFFACWQMVASFHSI